MLVFAAAKPLVQVLLPVVPTVVSAAAFASVPRARAVAWLPLVALAVALLFVPWAVVVALLPNPSAVLVAVPPLVADELAVAALVAMDTAALFEPSATLFAVEPSLALDTATPL